MVSSTAGSSSGGRIRRVATVSPALDDVRRMVWERSEFSFIPDRDLPALDGTAQTGTGPRLLFAGFPSDYSLAFLLALLQLDVMVVGLLTSPGAHEAILGDNALSRIADHLDVPLLRAWRVNDEHSILDLAALRLDGVVMASFDQIIGSRALGVPQHGWMNVHPERATGAARSRARLLDHCRRRPHRRDHAAPRCSQGGRRSHPCAAHDRGGGRRHLGHADPAPLRARHGGARGRGGAACSATCRESRST